MAEYRVGDYIYDRLTGEFVIYSERYNYMSDAHKDMVIRHATPEEIKAGRRL